MGTRADFYVGRGEKAEWLGSVAWDGYPNGIPDSIKLARTDDAYRTAVDAFLRDRDDATRPADGWPWPWDDSATTDFAYAFDGARTYGSRFGGAWAPVDIEWPEDGPEGDKAIFPNMKAIKHVAHGDRSGMIVIGIK